MISRIARKFSGGFASVLAGTAIVSSSAADFRSEIAPILAAKCFACHNPEKAKGGFRLDTAEQLLRMEANKNAPVVPGKPGQSRLVTLLQSEDQDDRMPLDDDPLPSHQIQKIIDWIQNGAVVSEDDRKLDIRSFAALPPRKPAPKVYPRPIPVTALAFIDGGLRLASGGYHEVLVWDVATASLARRIPNLPARILTLVADGQNQWLAVGGGQPGRSGELWLAPLQGDAPPRLIASCPDVVLAAAFSSDGSRLVVGGADNTIRVFSTRDLKQTLTIQQHADWVRSIVFTKDGHRVVSSSRDRTARVFLTKTGELEATFADHSAAIAGAVLTPDVNRIISGGRDKRLLLWNLMDGKKASDLASFDSEIVAIESRGADVLVATADGSLRHFSSAEKKEKGRLGPGSSRVHAIAIDASTSAAASGGHDGEVRLWDLTNHSLRAKFIASPMARKSLSTIQSNSGKAVPALKPSTQTLEAETSRFSRIPLEFGQFRFPNGGHIQGVQLKSMDGIGNERLFLSHDSDAVAYIAVAERAPNGAGSRRATVRHVIELPSDGKQPPLRHPGGIQLLGDILAVGVEDNQDKFRSQVQFWDVSIPHAPRQRTPLTINRESSTPKRKTAGAVGLIDRGTNVLAVVANWDSAILDFYESNGKPLSDEASRFDLRWVWDSAEANRTGWSPDQHWGKYQALNLLKDESGRILLAGFHTTPDARNVVDLFEITLGAPIYERIRKVLSIGVRLPGATMFRYGGGLQITTNKTLRWLATSESIRNRGSVALSR